MSRNLFHLAVFSFLLTVLLSLALVGCTDSGETSAVESTAISDGASSSHGVTSLPNETESSWTEESQTAPSHDPELSDDPMTSDDPESSDDPAPSDDPEPSDDSAVSQDSAFSQEPSTSDDPDVSQEPEVSDEPDVSDDPDASVDPDAPDGTKEKPYLAYPSEDYAIQTEEIPAKSEVYYSIYRAGGMDFILQDANAYVIYDGVTYRPKDGVIIFRIGYAMASQPISFRIGNEGSSDASFTITFSPPKGTYANPDVAGKAGEDQQISLKSGDEIGYYYTLEATQDGTIRFYMTATKSSIVVATNQSTSAQRSTGDEEKKDDLGRLYFDLEVKKGDIVLINMGALPNIKNKYPATTITWSFEYL